MLFHIGRDLCSVAKYYCRGDISNQLGNIGGASFTVINCYENCSLQSKQETYFHWRSHSNIFIECSLNISSADCCLTFTEIGVAIRRMERHEEIWLWLTESYRYRLNCHLEMGITNYHITDLKGRQCKLQTARLDSSQVNFYGCCLPFLRTIGDRSPHRELLVM